jgi:putative transposase
MTRPLRIFFPDAYYHVTCRGNGKQNIFLADHDRKKFIELLARSAEVYQISVLAFVLMSNHFHLIVKTPRANLNDFMRHFNISYTVYFNKRHHRSGHLYQGRYKSFLIDADSYLVEVSRYLHRNPVHTQKFTSVDDEQKSQYLRQYRWSTYLDYIQEKPRHPFVEVNEVLGYFGNSKSQYQQFVEDGLSSSVKPLEAGKGHGIVGNASFIKRFVNEIRQDAIREQPSARKIVSQVEPERVLDAVADRFQTSKDEITKKTYRGPARSLAMELLYRYAGVNQREIGALMGIDYSSVSVARKRLQDSLVHDQKLRKHFTLLKRKISQE